jgi:hypothetical protein
VTRPLIVSVAHGLDFVTFLLALLAFGGIGGESSGFMASVYMAGGLLAVLALKASGTMALACLSQMRTWMLVPAAGAGILGAVANLSALAILGGKL